MSFSAPQPQHHGATAHGTDKAPGDPGTAGHLDPELAWGHHLLVLAEGIEPEDVEALALSRFPGASRRDEHTIDLAPAAWLTGPWRLDAAARTALGLPEQASAAYLARAPVLRGGPVPEELRGLGGLLDAFAEGTPEGTEAEIVEFLFAAARRLGGALRAGGTGVLLVPDPSRFVDLLVHSPVWLEPDALQSVLEPVLPGLQLLDLPVHAPLPMPPAAPEDLDEAEQFQRAQRHATADAIDAAALAADPVHESYGAVWRAGDDGVISVHVEALEDPPTVLLGLDWASEGLLTYHVRWYPRDPEGSEASDAEPGDAETVGPDSGDREPEAALEDGPDRQTHDDEAHPGEHAAAGAFAVGHSAGLSTEQVRLLIEDAAAAILAAAGGTIADDDGFLVDLQVADSDHPTPDPM